MLPGFNVQLVSLSQATGSVSIGNLSAFDVIGSKAREISGFSTVFLPNGNEESCQWQQHNFKSKALSRVAQLIIVILTWSIRLTVIAF